MTDANPFADIKAVERQELERLNTYLRQLDADGWIEQSYCSDWLVYQAVSHLASGAHIAKARLDAWVNGAPAMTRDDQLAIWAKFDALEPSQMLSEYLKAVGEYLVAVRSIDDEAGLREVEGFAGKRPLYVYQLARLWELVSHGWDVYVARDRNARFSAEAVGVLAPLLHTLNLPVDRSRAADFAERPVEVKLNDPSASYLLDLSGDRPRLRSGSNIDAALVVEGPAEEMCRFVAGRHFVPGSKPRLRVAAGSKDDLAKLRRAFR
jgi:uncharacterized protein (TIGR03083 family)